MNTKIVTAAVLMSISAFGAAAAHADELRPMQAGRVSLGDVTGVAYYTVEGSDLRVVTTLNSGESGSPMRFVSNLSDGQRITIEVPGATGDAAGQLVIRRTGDTVDISSKADLRASLALD